MTAYGPTKKQRAQAVRALAIAVNTLVRMDERAAVKRCKAAGIINGSSISRAICLVHDEIKKLEG